MSAAPPTVAAPPANCPSHPESPSVATCSRCGRFICELCQASTSPLLCTDCKSRIPDFDAFLNPRPRWAQVLLRFIAVVHGAVAFLMVLSPALTADIEDTVWEGAAASDPDWWIAAGWFAACVYLV